MPSIHICRFQFVSLRESSQTLLTIEKDYLFVEVDVSELEANIKISDYFHGAAPVFIVNDIDQPILYGQKGVTKWAENKYVRKILPRKSVYFCWLEPMGQKEFVYKIGTQDTEQTLSLTVDNFGCINEKWNFVSFLDGRQRILLFTLDVNLPRYLLNVSIQSLFLNFQPCFFRWTNLSNQISVLSSL